MTDVPTLVEVRTRTGEVRWHLLGARGRRVLKPYRAFADACQVASEVAALLRRGPSPPTPGASHPADPGRGGTAR
jgi:hypothetical protein